MPKYLTLFLMVFFFSLIFFGYYFYFKSPSQKEISAEQDRIEETLSVSPIEKSSEEKGESAENLQNEELNNYPEAKEEIKKEENNKKLEKIIPRLVSWGYEKSQKRFIDTIIIHTSYNALGGDFYNLEKILQEYQEYGVAPHFLIDRDGKVYQLVSENNIAYHAGEGRMPDGRKGINNFSLGIELMNTEKEKITDSQYQSLKQLIAFLKGKNKINYILGHNQIAPGRKTDPWNFDREQLK
jgi:N-acetyl-anhydromuramyl-L-alanine amidase AmpD